VNGLAVEFQRRHSRDGTEELHPGLAQGFALLLAMLGPTIPALHIVRLVEEEVDAVEGILDEGNGGSKTRAGNGAAVAFEWVLAPSRRRVAALPSGVSAKNGQRESVERVPGGSENVRMKAIVTQDDTENAIRADILGTSFVENH
jgi:hypothetical protein